MAVLYYPVYFRHHLYRWDRKLNSFELNKIMMALLLTVLIMLGIGGLTGVIFEEDKLTSNAFPIEMETVAAETTPAVVEQGPSLADMLIVASVEKGQKIFKKCKACHTSAQGGKNLVGPNLWNIVGRDKGSLDGFSYSNAMKTKGGVWTYDDLNAFLTKPGKFVAKTKMSFAGLKKPADRAAVIMLLRTLSDTPMALPVVAGPAVVEPVVDAGEEDGAASEEAPEEKASE